MRHRVIAAVAFSWLPLSAHASCPSPGQWWQSQNSVANSAILTQASQHQVVLLGEQHDAADHHRWQLHTLAGLHALRDDMVIGLEMLPRGVQDVLDDWVAGLLTEEELLAQSHWEETWGFDANLYLPIFHFARLHNIPLIALNITPELRQRLSSEGFTNVPAEQRHHIPAPLPPSDRYEKRLKEVFDQHAMGDDPAMLNRFVQAQLSWDVAMAEGLANAATEGALAVGLMGLGHVIYHDGVPHQLTGLGVDHTFSLLPWSTEACEPPNPELADAVFVLPTAE
ncbi:ChaN family lipoprotein [Halomonas qaidamensis]|uniref:ChaN family lipoprotein n=1 Tax=Halomonas qaidamensis TaxID=2866211 RepID=A0ABY6JQP4_9GAMM|nr:MULTISPECIES: ChaN family lipoprotein [Halomonas]UYV19331.1 ChaN family lipoprotein [Halomonas qaidamensis]